MDLTLAKVWRYIQSGEVAHGKPSSWILTDEYAAGVVGAEVRG